MHNPSKEKKSELAPQNADKVWMNLIGIHIDIEFTIDQCVW